MAEKDDVYTVSGEFRDAGRQPVSGGIVQAIDLNRAAEGRWLGEAVTDAMGQFRITYRRADFARSMAEALGKTGPWLMLRVLAPDGSVLAAARARPTAGRTEHYVLILPERLDATTAAGRALTFWSERLGRPLGDLADLRAAALSEAAVGVGGREAQRLAALVALSQHFGPEAAAAFEEAGADTLPDLLAWPDERVAGALLLSGLTPVEQHSAAQRVAALRTAESLPESGLEFDVGPGFLSEADIAALQGGGVLTLEEWRNRRDGLPLAEETRTRLDAHLRLAACQADPLLARALIAAGIASAHALAAADPVALAAQLEVDAAVLAPVVVCASDRVAAIPARLAASVLHHDEPAPGWLAATQPRSGDLWAGWAAMEPAVAPELVAFRSGRALTAIGTSVERRDRRAALAALLASLPPAEDPDLARAITVIDAALTADAAFDEGATALAAATALDRMAAATFPEGSPARQPALNDTRDDAARLVAAWGFAATEAPGPVPDLPLLPEGVSAEMLDAASIGAWLDAGLGLALHLRIAGLPLLQAQEAAAAGERQAAMIALDRLDAAIAVHPWAAPAPAALCPVTSPDTRLARLHRGNVLARLAAITGDPTLTGEVEQLQGRSAPVPAIRPADIDAIATGGRAAVDAAITRWRQSAFRTKATPRSPDILVDAELHLPLRFDPAASALDADAAQRVLDAWYAGACFRPVAAAMAQLLAVAPRPTSGLSLDGVLTQHEFAARTARTAGAALLDPVQRWEASAASNSVPGTSGLRIAYADWLAQTKAWQEAANAALAQSRQRIGEVMIGERLALLMDAAAEAAGGTPPAPAIAAAPARLPVSAAVPADPRAQTIRLTLSLSELAPVAMHELRTGPGRLLFRTSIADLQRRFPGATLLQLEQARFRLIGRNLPTNGAAHALVSILTLDNERPQPMVLEARPGLAGDITLRLPRPLAAQVQRASLDLVWCLDLPKAANRLDLSEVSDIQLELRVAVVLAQPPAMPAGPVPAQGELLVSLVRDYPKIWMQLIGAARDGGPLTANLPVMPGMFPPHVAGMKLTDIAVQAPRISSLVTLRHSDRAATALLESGIASTRRHDLTGEHPWQALRGLAPYGRWVIEFNDDPGTRTALAENRVGNVILMLGYTGELPPWPV